MKVSSNSSIRELEKIKQNVEVRQNEYSQKINTQNEYKRMEINKNMSDIEYSNIKANNVDKKYDTKPKEINISIQA